MLLALHHVGKTYQNPKRVVLSDCSLQIQKGESLAIVGPSGSGKTTLLNLIAMLDKPNEGQILYEGQEITQFTDKEVDHYRRFSLGIVFQLHHLLPQLNLIENVKLPLLGIRDKKVLADADHRAMDLMGKVGIANLKTQKPAELSGGECQRAAVVRALINQPGLLLADEPTGALDSENSETLTDLLLKLHKEQHLALLVVTHSEQLAARMDRRIRLTEGQLKEI